MAHFYSAALLLKRAKKLGYKAKLLELSHIDEEMTLILLAEMKNRDKKSGECFRDMLQFT